MSTTIQSAPASASSQIIEVSRPRVHNLHHVALRTPKLEESVDFFVRVLGMHEVRREGSYVYLKAYGEWSHHSLILIGADRPGLDHMGWQVAEPEHLEGWVRRFEEQGLDYSRLPAGSELGQGDAVRLHLSRRSGVRAVLRLRSVHTAASLEAAQPARPHPRARDPGTTP